MANIDERHVIVLGQILATLKALLAVATQTMEIVAENLLVSKMIAEDTHQIVESQQRIEAFLTRGEITLRYQRTVPPASISVTYAEGVQEKTSRRVRTWQT
jgi:uncharacterized protein YndB with AHSA1/START domain